MLLAAGQADGTTLKQGIVGDDRIKPYNIVIIFMSQARRAVRAADRDHQRCPRTSLGTHEGDAPPSAGQRSNFTC